jgi:hypothetical protein
MLGSDERSVQNVALLTTSPLKTMIIFDEE